MGDSQSQLINIYALIKSQLSSMLAFYLIKLLIAKREQH